MKKKVSLPQNFYLGCVYIPSCEAHKHCRAEIAQYRLEIIFNLTLIQFYMICSKMYIKQNYNNRISIIKMFGNQFHLVLISYTYLDKCYNSYGNSSTYSLDSLCIHRSMPSTDSPCDYHDNLTAENDAM